MKQEIAVKIQWREDKPPIVMVRKLVLKDDGMVDKKFGLTTSGDWVEVPEAAMYPDECYLPLEIW